MTSWWEAYKPAPARPDADRGQSASPRCPRCGQVLEERAVVEFLRAVESAGHSAVDMARYALVRGLPWPPNEQDRRQILGVLRERGR